jgi:two-component system, OmpR family, KDP operon response regulator KdpE
MPSIRVQGLEIDFITGNIYLNGHSLYLSLTEYRLLSILGHNLGKFVSTEKLLKCIWTGNPNEDELGVVRVNIARLRRKLGDNIDNPKYIQSEPGLGYSLSYDQSR